jgi:hypothetical protein
MAYTKHDDQPDARAWMLKTIILTPKKNNFLYINIKMIVSV